MKPLETVWHALVQRRLLPVAILLIAALAAIPFVLAEDPKPVAAPVAGGDESKAATAASGESVVSLVEDGELPKRRRVLGASKDPFEPAAAPKAAKTPAPVAGTQPDGGAKAPGGDVTVTGGSPGGSSTPPASVPPAAAPPVSDGPDEAPKPRHELYSLTVRFGSSEEASLPRMNLPRLKALPSAEDPVLVYLGVGKDSKTAIFMVDAAIEPQGDGTCKPSPANCETLHLREGDTEFLDVTDEAGTVTAQYQLDLVDIKRKTTSSASTARAARARASKSGRRVLRARQAARGPLRYSYDARRGVVKRLDHKAFKAAVARSALAMAGGFDIER